MTFAAVAIESGFAVVAAGAWLVGRGQPAAFHGEAVRRRRKGWLVRDRSAIDLVETTGQAWCASAERPFLTHIPCAAPVAAVSGKVLVAPAPARTGAELVKIVPMSVRGAICVTRFGSLEDGEDGSPEERGPGNFVVMATASRTARISVEDGGTLSVRPEAVVAWTGGLPTGFVRRLGVWDVLLPRTPRDMMLHFHGPCIVWVEGSGDPYLNAPKLPNFQRRPYGF